MADTLIEDAPPPTVRDDSLGAPEPPRAPERRATWPAWLAMLVLFVLGCGAVAYEIYVRHEPVARRHIPSNANLAVHVEAADLALFKPARDKLWPVLEEELARPSDPGCGGDTRPRAQRLEAATGVRFDRDVREIVIASVDAASWVAIVAGNLPRGRFVDGLAKVLADEGNLDARKAAGLLVLANGFAVGQADDGSIVAGTDASLVTAALPSTDDAAALGLPEGGGLAFAATKLAWGGASDTLARSLKATLAPGVERATGRMRLGSSPELELRLAPAQGAAPPAVAEQAEAMLRDLRLATVPLPDFAGEKQALGAAQVRPEAAEVVVTAAWPYEGLERGCAALADALRDRRDAPRAP